jgi:flavin reductase (DIM6/NTAB) family NADH-FMN oxidoreductase RutF
MEESIWDKVFMVFPLVVVGTREEDASYDLAPKHMAMPLSWKNHFGFVCTPSHGTYHNAKREGVFTVSYPKPSQWLQTSLTAAPRSADGQKHMLDMVDTIPAEVINGAFIAEGYLYFECELVRIIDDIDDNSLVIGKIIAAHVDNDYLRSIQKDDQDLIYNQPLISYLHPGRFAEIRQSQAFPFPKGMKK